MQRILKLSVRMKPCQAPRNHGSALASTAARGTEVKELRSTVKVGSKRRPARTIVEFNRAGHYASLGRCAPVPTHCSVIPSLGRLLPFLGCRHRSLVAASAVRGQTELYTRAGDVLTSGHISWETIGVSTVS